MTTDNCCTRLQTAFAAFDYAHAQLRAAAFAVVQSLVPNVATIEPDMHTEFDDAGLQYPLYRGAKLLCRHSSVFVPDEDAVYFDGSSLDAETEALALALQGENPEMDETSAREACLAQRLGIAITDLGPLTQAISWLSREHLGDAFDIPRPSDDQGLASRPTNIDSPDLADLLEDLESRDHPTLRVTRTEPTV
ncbi:hypothetical protein C7S18_23905 (plasmid) [Ahniella affigens]|uniref:Uncharacterized protein n=1 Tax=Ahniella affigens TaxID=2021234 RepID=A0A2P1PZT7_9GAMM|nr:hypothetical protein [Ahniella affigens]AVQ00346.1 hypothetical protein C7S18_23905 [Ahniella affigens]